MSHIVKKLVFVFVGTLVAVLLSACGQDKYYNNVFLLDEAFQTVSNVQLFTYEKKLDEKTFKEVEDSLNKILHGLDDLFNIQKRNGVAADTDLSKINAAAGKEHPVVVDSEVIYVIEKALEMAKKSLVDNIALFDPTIAPVWQAWDFTGDRLYKQEFFGEGNKIENPIPSNLNELIEKVDYTKVVINKEASTVYLKDEGMGLDLGAIVKGYAADKVKEYLASKGYTKAVIDIGRNIQTLGSGFNKENKDTDWKVQIQSPFYTPEYDEDFLITNEETKTYGTVYVSDETVVTSGTYEKYIMDTEGEMYHHILNPITGKPFVNDVLSITAITKDSILGDGYSTTLFSLGLDKGMELVNMTEGLEAVWVIDNKTSKKKEVYISSGLEGNFVFNKEVEKANYVYKGVYK